MSIETERERALLPPPSLFLQRFCPSLSPSASNKLWRSLSRGKNRKGENLPRQGKGASKTTVSFDGRILPRQKRERSERKVQSSWKQVLTSPLRSKNEPNCTLSLSLSSLSQLSPARSTESPSRHAAASPPRRAAATAGIRGSAPPRPHCRRRRSLRWLRSSGRC